MKATDLLRKQHQEMRDLFTQLECEDEEDSRRESFEELAIRLVGHDSVERNIFYPACEEHMGMMDNLGEALVEHGVIEFALYQADQARQEDDFRFKCKVLREVLEHHIVDEESKLFPDVETALGEELLGKLGAEMLDAFQATLEEDFRVSLREHLKEALSSTLRPVTQRAPARGRVTERTRESA
jgi:hypothetical protein